MKKKVASYQSIALDLAKRIVNDEFLVGEKISGRTLLASQYNVSPETVRKAVAMLKETNVVAVSQGKEIVVLSAEQATHFIEQHKEMVSAYSLKQELEILLEKKVVAIERAVELGEFLQRQFTGLDDEGEHGELAAGFLAFLV